MLLKGTVSSYYYPPPLTVSITHDGQTFTPTVSNNAFQQQLTFKAAKQYPIEVCANDSNYSGIKVRRNVIFSGVIGDCNADGVVNVFDALLTLQHAVGLIEHNVANDLTYKSLADVAPLVNGKPQGDSKVDVFDALAILRHAVGLDAW